MGIFNNNIEKESQLLDEKEYVIYKISSNLSLNLAE